jgi:hypothetical protein
MSTPEVVPVIASRDMNVIDPLTGVERSIRAGDEVPLLLLEPYEAGEEAPATREEDVVHMEPEAEPTKPVAPPKAEKAAGTASQK